MVLLYIPPVQNLLRREVTAYASEATGMQIQVERIDLRFPLNLENPFLPLSESLP